MSDDNLCIVCGIWVGWDISDSFSPEEPKRCHECLCDAKKESLHKTGKTIIRENRNEFMGINTKTSSS